MKFNLLVEHQIRRAQMKGELDGLEGEGAPLPDQPPDDLATAAGFRIMAEAGALPEEIPLRKQVAEAARHLAGLTGPA